MVRRTHLAFRRTKCRLSWLVIEIIRFGVKFWIKGVVLFILICFFGVGMFLEGASDLENFPFFYSIMEYVFFFLGKLTDFGNFYADIT